MPPDDSTPLTLSQAAEALGVSVRTVQRRLKAGALDAYKLHTAQGFEWRIRLPVCPAGPAGVTPPAPVTPVSPPAVTHDKIGPLAVTSHAPTAPTPRGDELARLALLAVDELARENARLRAEGERLRAEVARLAAPWWRRWSDRARRRRR